MTKYESGIKTIYATTQRVYEKLSDLSHLQTLQERLSDPAYADIIRQQSAGKVTDEQLQQIQSKVAEMQFTTDAVSVPVEQLGGAITLGIIEREAPKLIKMVLLGAPVEANLWIQLLPCNEGTRMKVTIGAELNFFIKQMVGKKLETGVDKLADMLAMIPY